jgi:hypothetical protein
MSATSIYDLTLEQYSAAIDKVDEIFDQYPVDSQEYKDLLDCGYVDKEPFEVLQCWRDKGHVVE